MNVNFKALVRDVAIVMGLTFLGGFVIGFANPNELNMLAIAVSNILFSIVGFFIAGCLTKNSRFHHLIIVVLAVWVIGSYNMLLGITFIQWLFSLVFLLITMSKQKQWGQIYLAWRLGTS